MNTIELVGDFHAKVGFTEPELLIAPSRDVYMRHIGLILEEMAELCRAVATHDEVEQLDAVTDLRYILDGTARMCGIKHKEPLKCGVPASRDVYDTIYMLNIDILALMEAFIQGNAGSVEKAFWLIDIGVGMLISVLGFERIADLAFVEVHKSNMTKDVLHEGRSGKILKGINFQPPQLSHLIVLNKMPLGPAVLEGM